MTKSTIKLSIRKGSRNNRGKLFGVRKLKSGWRGDAPWCSLSLFNGGTNNHTIRSNTSGVRVIYENNRTNKTRVTHNVT